MTQEAMPVGNVCNLACSYCYEQPLREAGNAGGKYDVDAMLKTLDANGEDFVLFGGEPLLMKLKDMRKMLEHGYKKHGHTGIMTNGLLISSSHIRLFKDTRCSVGVSIDGPDDCNSPRCGHDGNIANTRKSTRRIMRNIRRCVDGGLGVALIITIHRANGLPKDRERFKAWLKELDEIPIGHARLHLLETHHNPEIALTESENIEFFLDMAKFEMRELKHLRFDKFGEMLNNLKGEDKESSCVWKNCDVYTTDAVKGVNGDGTRSNCGRANKDGINWLKSDKTSHDRQVALYNTPQEHGGCKDCRFFLVCRGYCPGTAIDSDWRNRTEHCGTIKALYGYFENVLLDNRIIPITLCKDLEDRERAALGQVTGQTYTNHIDWTMINGVKVHKVQVIR